MPVKDITLAALVTDYVNHRATDKAGVAIAAKRNWRLHLHPFFADSKVSYLATSDFTSYRLHRVAEGASQTSVNRELQVVIASYKLAPLNSTKS